MSAGKMGVEVKLLPMASLMAAMVAGMLGISAGSPTPLAPKGPASPSLLTTMG